MAEGGGQEDLEYWLEGSPRRGPLPQKNPPLGGKRQDPRNLADTGMASQGQKKRGICPQPKRWPTKDRLSEKKTGGGDPSPKGVSLTWSRLPNHLMAQILPGPLGIARNKKPQQASSSTHTPKWRQGSLSFPRAG